MHLFITCILIAGPAILLIVGFLSLVGDLLSRNVFAAPFSPHEDQVEQIAGDTGASAAGGSLHHLIGQEKMPL